MNTIVIATPHHRNDILVEKLRLRLTESIIIRVLSPKELNISMLTELKPDYIFFPHWSWIIPVEIYTQFECVIFHMTDLPYGRGGSPLQNLIVRGNKETKLTALRCVKKLDAGPIYTKVPLLLTGTAEEILQHASNLMEEVIVNIIKTRPEPFSQRGEVVTFKRRKQNDGNLSELESLNQIYDYIRMLDAEGYPPAFLETNNMIYEFNSAILSDDLVEATVNIRKK